MAYGILHPKKTSDVGMYHIYIAANIWIIALLLMYMPWKQYNNINTDNSIDFVYHVSISDTQYL